MTLKASGVLLLSASVVLTSGVCLALIRQSLRSAMADGMQANMRNILVTAENTRESMSGLRKARAFDEEGMQKELQARGGGLRESSFYATIPVVAAWKSVEKAAAQEGYEFRIAAEHPRNVRHTPEEGERKILELFEAEAGKGGGRKEYFALDRERDEIVYARPVVLSQDCLVCHGDPAKSRTGDGKDPLGMTMEGWREGQIHGVFLLRGSLKRYDAAVRAELGKALLWMIGPVGLLLLGLPLGLRPIQRRLAGNIANMGKEAVLLEETAGELSQHSEKLARAATEQAAAVEQSSATMGEIHAMTQRNAEHAVGAARAVEESTAEMAGMERALRSLEEAMRGIRDSSGEISRITKVMDELAFQTNILSLNASIEAARAGEAGLGFAVVAAEVRNLAQRSAEAAKEIQALVEGSTAKTAAGEAAMELVEQSVEAVEGRSRSLEERVKSVAAASEEQARGVREMNAVLAQISVITQQMAASADAAEGDSARLLERMAGLQETAGNLDALLR